MQKDLEEKKRRAAAAAGSGKNREPSTSGRATAAANGSSSSSRGRLDYWLAPGVVVKVLSKALKEHGYYKQKGVVWKVIDRYVGEISMLDSGDVIRIDQAELETVLPAPGGQVLVVNGTYRGSHGTLQGIDTGRYQAQVLLTSGKYDGVQEWFDYEDICKVASK
eukprot:GHRR01012480.1.p2 GENE.GHRR01012480.1~~GHRR01012480.1.p2  ORF type:complete len:164 (+),score=67.56 GHRR01012480.1:766-1257(+)